ncbi:MAG: nucleoside-diphosphate-sugar epimerase [Gemmatimonadetes bacterium]|nr:nucleoside-diphosphate-sugar epimerase [Gemmatimonadota bacterium]
MSKVLVTGAAGFIGSHVAARLLADGVEVVGLDNLNDYYSVALKRARLGRIATHPSFRFAETDITNRDEMARLFQAERFDKVVHLAAQAGVRYSLQNPSAYTDTNITGFLHILEGCRHSNVGHLVYASSSSVYGSNTELPFRTSDSVDHPISLYAATKKANELMAHTYSHLFGIPSSGLRFFTVYGPWGRPDMSVFLFTKAILNGENIDVFNDGRMQRDFTYIDDIVEGVVRVLAVIPGPREVAGSSSRAPYRVYNIGNNRPVELMRMIEVLESAIGRPATKRMLPMQPGDVPATYADVDDLQQAVGFRPDTPLEVGLGRFVEWYRQYHGV